MGNIIELCVYVKSEFLCIYYVKLVDGLIKYRNELELREMIFYGGSKIVLLVLINVKGEVLCGKWGVLGGLLIGGLFEFFKKWNYYKEIDEMDCFFVLNIMMYIINY